MVMMSSCPPSCYFKFEFYSGTPLIRLPPGHGKLVVLMEWSYCRACLNKKISE